jgi:PAS domain-containing protein
VDTVAANGDRDLREMLDWAITQAPVSIALIDTQMRQLRLNTSMCRILGLDDEAAGLGLRLSCEVSDGSSSAPHLRRADRYDEDGRGLMLVAQLTERWGSRHTRTGKTIWAQQPLAPGLT